MKKQRDNLLEYEHNEKLFIKKASNLIREKGKIEKPSDIYPEIQIPNTLTYRSGDIPLSYLLLLYEKLVLFIPPSTKDILENKWHMSFNTVIELCEQKYIIPLIGHPTEYDAPHFDPLLRLKPPSVWARGLTLLNELGLGDKLIEANCPLPIDKMAKLPSLENKYQRHFPNLTKKELYETIKRELLTYYADLWLFGEGDLANCISNIKNPELVTERLFLTNEICTYPILFGLGGTANFDLHTFSNPTHIKHYVHSSKRFKIIPKDLDILLRGVDLDFEGLSLKKIMEFHSSGASKELQDALQKFENYSKQIIRNINNIDDQIEEYIVSAQHFEQKIKEIGKEFSTNSFRQKISKAEQNFIYGIRIGGIVLGSSLYFLLDAQTIGTISGISALWDKILPPSMTDKVIRSYLDNKFYPGLSNLWKIVKRK